METVIQLFNQIVSEAFEKCGYPRELGVVSVSDRPDLSQFQCNGAFTAAKQVRKAPHIIANQVAQILSTCNRQVASPKSWKP